MKLNLPKSWANVTLKQYCILKEIQDDPDIDQATKDIDMICLLSGLKYGQVLELTLKDKQAALKSLTFLQSFDSIKKKINPYFLLKGKWYKIALNMQDITGGQLIDLMTFLKEPDKAIENIHNVFAVIASPLKYGLYKQKYNGETHAARAKLFFESLTIEKTYPVMVFFCQISDHLVIALENYTKNKIAHMKKELTK